jgi:hypothetical protein
MIHSAIAASRQVLYVDTAAVAGPRNTVAYSDRVLMPEAFSPVDSVYASRDPYGYDRLSQSSPNWRESAEANADASSAYSTCNLAAKQCTN